MRTEVDLTRLTPRQREVLTALARRLSKNEVERLLQIVAAATCSGGVISEAVKTATSSVLVTQSHRETEAQARSR